MARAPQAGLAALLALVTLCAAAPSHYFAMHATDAVRAAHAEMRAWVAAPAGGGGAARRRLAKKRDGDGIDCGTPPEEGAPRDPMWFTQAGCSLSGMEGFAYMDSNGNFRNASKGDLIQARWLDTAAGQRHPAPACMHMPTALLDGVPLATPGAVGPLALLANPAVPSLQAPRLPHPSLATPCRRPATTCSAPSPPSPTATRTRESAGRASGAGSTSMRRWGACGVQLLGDPVGTQSAACRCCSPGCVPYLGHRLQHCIPLQHAPAPLPPPRSGAPGPWAPAARRPTPSPAARRRAPRLRTQMPRRSRRRRCGPP